MKKIYVIFLLLNLSTGWLFAQNISKIRELSLIAKTWGLLKYYHPEIAGGKHNWDSTLVVSISNILKTNKIDQANTEIIRMLEIAGKDTASAYLAGKLDPISGRNYDVSWIDRSNRLNTEQKQLLAYIAKHPYQGMNYYAQPSVENDSTVSTPNEKPYQEMAYPDVNYRLLSLFRFWNVINYFYPYKYKIGKSWDLVLEEMIPAMIQATDTISYHRALAKMAASINDSHGGLWPEVFVSMVGKYSPPFDFKLIDGKAIITKIPNNSLGKQDLQVGSIVNAIDGVSIRQRIREYWDYVPASNSGGKLKSMHAFILNSQSPKAVFSGKDQTGKRFETKVSQIKRNFLKDYLSFFEMENPIIAKMLDGNIGYVYFSNLNKRNLDSAMKVVLNSKAIIFDMRNYPEHGTGTYHVPNYLLDKPELYARNTYPDFSVPGMFKSMIANEGTDFSRVGKYNTSPFQGKVILLVDSRTQSAAEWSCMTLMTAKNVTVIGNQTAGADGNVTRTILPGGYKIQFSGLGIYFPNMKETQRIGIPIDIKVKYTLRDAIEHKDPILDKAIDFANGK